MTKTDEVLRELRYIADYGEDYQVAKNAIEVIKEQLRRVDFAASALRVVERRRDELLSRVAQLKSEREELYYQGYNDRAAHQENPPSKRDPLVCTGCGTAKADCVRYIPPLPGLAHGVACCPDCKHVTDR